MKVKAFCINRGQPTQYFVLANAKSGDILVYAPNRWKTEKGALRWAVKNGYTL